MNSLSTKRSYGTNCNTLKFSTHEMFRWNKELSNGMNIPEEVQGEILNKIIFK